MGEGLDPKSVKTAIGWSRVQGVLNTIDEAVTIKLEEDLEPVEKSLMTQTIRLEQVIKSNIAKDTTGVSDN